MKTPIFVHPLSEEERESLQKGLRSKDTFTMRRSQMLLASSRGERAPKIALNLGCASQTVRDAIHDFNGRGLLALQAKSSRPKRTRDAFDRQSAEELREVIHRFARIQRTPSRRESVARTVSPETRSSVSPSSKAASEAIARVHRLVWYPNSLGERWSISPTPCTKEKKAARPTDGSRRSRPRVGGGLLGRVLVEPGGPAHAQRLGRGGQAPSPHPTVGRQGRPRAESHKLLRTLPARSRSDVDQVRGREADFFDNDALSRVERAKARSRWQEGSRSHLGQRQLARLQRGEALARFPQPRVKESGEGVRIVGCLLPKQSPWLNAIEPKWIHGKRKVVEADGLLGTYELADRVCKVFDCPHHEHLTVPQKVA